MPLFKKLPAEIEAFQIPLAGGKLTPEMEAFLLSAAPSQEQSIKYLVEERPGDWVIKNARGEFTLCNAEIFAATYEFTRS